MLQYVLNPPNIITAAGMFFGFYSIVLAANAAPGDAHALYLAALMIVFACICDGLDGRVARLTGTSSDFGVQFDSLADLVAFGVAPAFIAYKWALADMGVAGIAAAFAFALCGALRLARFNITTSSIPKGFSQGLTITQSGGMVIAAVIFNYRVLDGTVQRPGLVLAALVGLAFLMVSNVWFRTFKDLKLNRRGVLFLGVVLFSMLAVLLKTREYAWLMVVYPGLHVATGLLEDILRYARGQTHAQLVAEYQAALLAEEHEEEQEHLVHL